MIPATEKRLAHWLDCVGYTIGQANLRTLIGIYLDASSVLDIVLLLVYNYYIRYKSRIPFSL